MKARNALIPLIAIAALSSPLAFAQDATTTAPTQDASAAAPQAEPATAAQPAQAADDTAKKITWADLDADKDGKLSKEETASVDSLAKVFDDADKDGALTPDEYKAYVAKNSAGTPADQGG